MHEHLALGRLCHINHLLHNIVGILVLHQHQEGAVGAVIVPTHLYKRQNAQYKELDRKHFLPVLSILLMQKLTSITFHSFYSSTLQLPFCLHFPLSVTCSFSRVEYKDTSPSLWNSLWTSYLYKGAVLYL